MWSHLTRGAWIEIQAERDGDCLTICRTSHEVRGLKSNTPDGFGVTFTGRTSHEVRGLKYFKTPLAHTKGTVAPHTRCVD